MDKFFEDQGRVLGPKRNAVADRYLNSLFPAFVGNVVHIAIRIQVLNINGDNTPSRNESDVTTAPNAPEAPCGCPTMDLVELTGTFMAYPFRAPLTANVSILSLITVEVP